MRTSRPFKQLLSIIAFFFAMGTVVAQQPVPPFPKTAPDPAGNKRVQCGSGLLLNELRQQKAYQQLEENMNRQVLSATGSLEGEEEIVLPVVFHIIHQNPQNIPDNLIRDALADLNNAFAKKGKYSGSKGADTRIRFCLAQKDPEGGITTGITRTKSYFADHQNPVIEDRRLKNLIQWDPTRFINIWFITTMEFEAFINFWCGQWIRGAVSAYATMPPGGGPLDGIVTTGFGVTLAHEMGHYLGLYHTFEGLNCVNNDCKTDGDRVCDTPPDAWMFGNANCTDPQNSCGTDTLSGFTTDQLDRTANFMDYSNQSCQNEFTEGQAERMRTVIATMRKGLLENQCDKPCTGNVLARFSRSQAYVVSGDVLQFTNNSSGATRFEWLFNNQVVATTANYSHTFNTPGKFKVTLKAYENGTCFSSQTDYVIVGCGVTARFYTDKRTLASKAPVFLDSVQFTNTSENAQSYRWLMRVNTGTEQLLTTNKDFRYVFTEPGTYNIRLIATNGACSDTTEVFPVQVFDPTQDGAVYINNVECFQQTKVRVSFFVCNNGYAPIPKGIPISFYDADPRLPGARKIDQTFFLPDTVRGFCCSRLYTQVLDVQRAGLNQIFAVFNDSGSVVPVRLPGTAMLEKDYNNNVWSFSGFRFRAAATPANAVMEPGDTLQLQAQAGPGIIKSYRWTPAQNLSCTSCALPNFIADTADAVRQVLVTSQNDCFDSAQVVIKVPPYNDFSVQVNQVECARGDSLLVSFTVSNAFRRGVIPKGLQVSFFDSDPFGTTATRLQPQFSVPETVRARTALFSIRVKAGSGRTVFAVVNDGGTAVPLVLPNTGFLEKDYRNNSGQLAYTPFRVTASPTESILEPGDTLQLRAQAGPDSVRSYQWRDAAQLSCTDCATTLFYADTTRPKTVVATSLYGCTDTAFVSIKVPPADDYTVVIDSVVCAAGDSLVVSFTLRNGFRRGLLRQGLSVAFFDGNPAAGGILQQPVFYLPQTTNARVASFTRKISGKDRGTLFAVVNHDGTRMPLRVGVDTVYKEKDYGNNTASLAHSPEKLLVAPAETTVLRKTLFPVALASPVFNPAATRWLPGGGTALSCTSCPSPQVAAYRADTIRVQSPNHYGCTLNGEAIVKILPPDYRIEILETACYSNSTTQVRFRICVGNRYDSVAAGVPVSFYEVASAGSFKLLSPAFLTRDISSDSCRVYTHIVQTPATNRLMAVVNDKGGRNGVSVPAFAESTFSNNAWVDTIQPFRVQVVPSDTLLQRFTPIQLVPQVSGGIVTSFNWSPAQFLSCTNCLAPVAAPQYSMQYRVTARNEYNCTDTAYAVVRTHTGGLINMPNAFTPDGDGLNDIFYVLASRDVVQVNNFIIFNRWGQQVFAVQNVVPNDPVHGWKGEVNGAKAASETFAWVLTVTLADGRKITEKGTVVVIR